MDIFERINTRRSVRVYKEGCVSDEEINRLLDFAVMAPSGSCKEPWGFVVINDLAEIKEWSGKSKEYTLEHPDELPYLSCYEKMLRNPKCNVFWNASTLLAVYGSSESHWSVYDCSFAAANIMLAAHAMGIGTCWIGHAEKIMNSPEFKERYNVPENYDMFCTMTMGYIKTSPPPRKRKPPVVFNRL